MKLNRITFILIICLFSGCAAETSRIRHYEEKAEQLYIDTFKYEQERVSLKKYNTELLYSRP